MTLWLLALSAQAYEADQWTGRDQALADVAPQANAAMNNAIDAALIEVRRRGCPVDEHVLQRRVARAIRTETGRRRMIGDRPLPQRMGHGRYSGWLESSEDVDRIEVGTRGVFDPVSATRSPVLALAGVASTVRIGDVRLGTDKIDHFLATGYAYWHRSRFGTAPDRASKWGAFTERTYYGMLTSKAFSYADLAANQAGFAFYDQLLGAGSIVQRDPETCVTRVDDWSWNDWVDPDWDEFLNPPVLTRPIEKRVLTRLDTEAFCTTWTTEGGAFVRAHREQTLSGARPPTRPDLADQACARQAR